MLIKCSTDKTVTQVYSTLGCSKIFKPINFDFLKDSSKLYDKIFVEISGYYCNNNFEQSAISNVKCSSSIQGMVWVDFASELVDVIHNRLEEKEKDQFLLQLNGRKIRVRGYLYANRHGHLSQYLVSLEHICYIEIF